MVATLNAPALELPNILAIVARLRGGAGNLIGRAARGIAGAAGRVAARFGAGRSAGT